MERAGTQQAVSVERIEPAETIALEFMMNALRLPDGVTAACFEARTGLSIRSVERPLTEAIRRGWMSADGGSLKATPNGLSVLNAVLELF